MQILKYRCGFDAFFYADFDVGFLKPRPIKHQVRTQSVSSYFDVD